MSDDQDRPKQLSVTHLRKLNDEKAESQRQLPPLVPPPTHAKTRIGVDENRFNSTLPDAVSAEMVKGSPFMIALPFIVVAVALLILLVSVVSWQMRLPGGPIWNQDPIWYTQRQVMSLCIAEKVADPASSAGLTEENPFGIMTINDRFGNAIHKMRGRYVSAGPDGTINTGDDIWADFLEFRFGGPVYAGPDDVAAMEASFPEEYRGRFQAALMASEP